MGYVFWFFFDCSPLDHSVFRQQGSLRDLVQREIRHIMLSLSRLS